MFRSHPLIPIVLCVFACAPVHAAGTIFSAILSGSGQEFATAVTSDAQGNTYVVGLTYSSDFPVTPGAFQTKFGGTCDAFISKVGPDGKLVWSTYLGGILDDWATGVALDSSGNVLVTGWTRSANFPLAHPLQTTLDSGFGDDYDAFVAKFDPNGASLLYSTFLGGPLDDGGAGIAVDPAGNAYVVLTTNSAAGFPGASQTAANLYGIMVSKLDPQGALLFSSFHNGGSPGGIALDSAGNIYVAGSFFSTLPSPATQSFGPPGASYVIAFKLSPDGKTKLYETALGGSVSASGNAIAVNAAGEAFIGGTTTSVDFPLVHALQSSPGARPLWKSSDGSLTWTPLDDLPFATPLALLPDPSTPGTIYAVTGDAGVLKTTNGAATWIQMNRGLNGALVQSLTLDPVHPQTVYAATASGTFKSTDGANTWLLIDAPGFVVVQVSVDAQNPTIVYEVGPNLRKSTDGGATWTSVTFPGTIATLGLDPRVSGHIFAISNPVFGSPFGTNSKPPYLYSSVDGGANWTQIQLNTQIGSPGLVVDASTNPTTIYQGLSARSVDGGVTWSAFGPFPFPSGTFTVMAVDPSGTLYVYVSGNNLNVSRDQGRTWTTTGAPIAPWNGAPGAGTSVIGLFPIGSGGTLFATTNLGGSSGFVSKLSADGATLEFSTYLRGHAHAENFLDYLAEPLDMLLQNWISSIALDPAGNIVVAGGTRAVDLPTASPAQSASAGLSDAFAARLAADGSAITYSTYFGGSGDDGALAAGVDPQGNVIVAGQTWSIDFPVPGGMQPPFGFGDTFLVKLATATPVITSVINGASYLPGIEAGSWVTIKGRNLANTNPGRTWTSAEIVNGNLPAALDGVSVTIDGKPAYVYYISPTQINVQAPTDSVVGTVNVVVNNNGMLSQPAAAQLQPAAPAFFTYYGTSLAVTSRASDFAAIGNPATVPGSIAAKPGDIVILWGTGFGATTPSVAAGVTVTGAPAVTPAPTLTVGGVSVPVISAVLSPGSVGVYQIAFQLPANIAAGPAAVQATMGGATTPVGVTIFVGN